MKISLLTSGFPNGFTQTFIKCIKKHYKHIGSFALISSDFKDNMRTDRHTTNFIKMFKDNDIIFNTVNIVDNRITTHRAIEHINNADIVWLAGGDTLKQISYINEYNLIPVLQKRNGVTIGMSAGSINMAKRVVLPRDINDNVPELKIYDGIGLVDVNIVPHINSSNDEYINDVNEATKHTTFYGLPDNSFIEIINEEVKIYGEHIKFEKT